MIKLLGIAVVLYLLGYVVGYWTLPTLTEKGKAFLEKLKS